MTIYLFCTFLCWKFCKSTQVSLNWLNILS